MGYSDEFVQLLSAKFSTVKDQQPGRGRRYYHLRVLDEFWNAGGGVATAAAAGNISSAAAYMQEEDPLDRILEEFDGLGILIRTDFSNEETWLEFVRKLQEAEKDFAESMDSGASAEDEDEDIAMGDATTTTSTTTATPQKEEAEQGDSDESDDEIPILIDVLNPTTTSDRAQFTNISNLTALRVLNDADIRAAPLPPKGTKRSTPASRLVDIGGFREVYTGKTLWVYDTRSNEDGCARLVSQEPDSSVYGTATGDSWRARVTHIPELQFNMGIQGMKIDFGGLDRWDYSERIRNIQEAAVLI